MGGMGKRDRQVAESLHTLSGLIREDLVELRDAVIQVDERTGNQSQKIEQKVTRLWDAFHTLDAEITRLYSRLSRLESIVDSTQRGKGNE